MMNNIKKCFVLSLMASFMFSCTDIETIDLEKEAVKDLYENRDKDKWAEEDAQKQQNYEDSVRIAEENKRLYELPCRFKGVQRNQASGDVRLVQRMEC